MQQMTKHRPLAELDLLDDLREQRAKVRASRDLGDCRDNLRNSRSVFLIVSF